MAKDIKHTNAWRCEICSRPSRETKVDMAAWVHLPEPRVVLYIHHLCEAGFNPCHAMIVAQGQIMGKIVGPGLPPEPWLPKPEGPDHQYPLELLWVPKGRYRFP
ncbi:unnamed protein product [Cyclocybe aegerita]|uniref:Uncharacterized protein n=1 Tax=Cyclocybe aegerita TaxID=1973307 RepID=A0A8S0VZ15_CYCAE|nr:unnamed protein product [Cyclocybe aegerita]